MLPAGLYYLNCGYMAPLPRAVCRNSYVHPAIVDAFRGGETIANAAKSAGPRRPNFSAAEAAVLALLKRRVRHEPAAAAA